MRTWSSLRKLAILACLLGASAFPLTGSQAATGKVGATFAVAAESQPIVRTAIAFGESSPVSDLPTIGPPKDPTGLVGKRESLTRPTGSGSFLGPDPVLQSGGGSGIPPTSQNFDGINIGESSSDGVFVGAPPDTDGDVGPNHYVQIVNTAFAIYSKTGQRLGGPFPINSLWESAPNAAQFNCTANSRGDPIVQYDAIADRWLITQFNFPGTAVILPPYDECIAVSQTPNPLGPYYLYDFRYSETIFNDYPKFGVWPDAYYMSVNQFNVLAGGTIVEFASAGACAYERVKMLAGDPNARQVCFDESEFDPRDANGDFLYGGQLPSDLNGTGIGASFASLPPPGSPNYFLQFVDSTTAGQDKLLMFKFHVDWANPANSWFGKDAASHGVPLEIPVADFDSNLCNFSRNCLPQKDSPDRLHAISDRLMYRLAYRNFGTHESLVTNHTVDVGTDRAGIRWYELRNPGGTPTVHQQSSWSPDAEHRFMGSIGLDQTGALALGYSLTSSTRYPAIAYTARRASDPLNQMSLGEAVMHQGTGSQLATGNRWGDYSSMQTDPNGCTFWYTTEYYPGTGTFNWATRIGAFTLPTCGDPQLSLNASSSSLRVRDELTYTLTVTAGQNPVVGAAVTDVLPSGVTLLSAASSKGTCGGLVTIVCNLGDLPAGDLQTITIKVTAPAAGTFTNTATLSTASPDSDPSNNTRSVQTAVFNPCVVPGFTRITDPTGDATGQNPAHDVQSVSIAEPSFGPGVNKLHFTLKMASLASVPPDTTWPVTFFYRGQQWFVAMKTNPLGQVSFRYGTGTGGSAGLGDLDAGSGFTPDGTITLIVSNSKIGTTNHPQAGESLTGFLTRIRIESQTGSALTPDNAPNSAAPDGDYTLSGNAFCANSAPTAALTATPRTGLEPLKVSFDGSGSSDPDAGDSVTSYTFRFGDGSTPVTQSTPAVSHTYAEAGTYEASLVVRDSTGQESTNAATVTITVSPAADVAVTKTGPASGKVGQTMSYTITVRNNGPRTAQGIVMTDTLPKNAGVGSVSSTQGTCAPKPKQQQVVCTIGTMANGATATITLVIKPTTKGSFTNTATVTASSPGDPVPGNNTSSVTTIVRP